MNEYQKDRDAQKKINYILLKQVIENLDELEKELNLNSKSFNTEGYRVGMNKRILEKIIGNINC
jgi:hypothetical protein|tara:strand:+ start:62 stop:253 length:192 start_codon:yes stop_codon:yes gene_type:complete